MKIIAYLTEGLAFLLIIIFLFNLLSQFLITLNLYEATQISYIGMIAILLATDNLLTKSFFGYKIV